MTHPGLLAAMSRPDFYSHHPEKVDVLQTHISFIFIAGDEVFKVKKAVDFDFLDFTTLQKRQFYCGEELRLNRRLAPDSYLEVVPISVDAAGGLRLGDGDTIVDYAVHMKRLPHDRMLRTLLAEGKVDIAVMDRIAAKLAAFHQKAETGGRIDEIGGSDTISRNHEENFTQMADYIGTTISRGCYDFIREYARDFLKKEEALLKQRVNDHKIRDCHGDLHMEHICIDNGITIFDCIEFNERFRFGDVCAEVAFLAMDLDYNGFPDWAEAFVKAYIHHSNDTDIPRLLNFYRCYYACVRGKVVGFRINDKAIAMEGRTEAVKTAAHYFDLAFAYAARPERPTLVLTAGLTGTGKSVLAQHLAPLLKAEVIRTDVLRKELLDIAPTERHEEPFGRGIYSGQMTQKTYAKALEIANGELAKGRTVIIDASYKDRDERLRAEALADALGIDFFLIECVASEETVRERLVARQTAGNDASDGRWEIYLAQKAAFEAITELPAEKHIVIDTKVAPEAGVETALRRIRAFSKLV